MEDGTNTTSDFTLHPLAFILRRTTISPGLARTNEESINLNKSGLYLRPETAGAFQLVPGHTYKRRKLVTIPEGLWISISGL